MAIILKVEFCGRSVEKWSSVENFYQEHKNLYCGQNLVGEDCALQDFFRNNS